MFEKICIIFYLVFISTISYAHDNSPSPLPESMNIPKYSPFGITIGEKFEDITYKDHKRSKEIKVKPPKPSRELFDEYYIQVNSDDAVYNIIAAADYSSNPRTFTCKEAVAFLKERIYIEYPYLKLHDDLNVFFEDKKSIKNNPYYTNVSISIDCMGQNLYLNYNSKQLEKVRSFKEKEFEGINPSL